MIIHKLFWPWFHKLSTFNSQKSNISQYYLALIYFDLKYCTLLDLCVIDALNNLLFYSYFNFLLNLNLFWSHFCYNFFFFHFLAFTCVFHFCWVIAFFYIFLLLLDLSCSHIFYYFGIVIVVELKIFINELQLPLSRFISFFNQIFLKFANLLFRLLLRFH